MKVRVALIAVVIIAVLMAVIMLHHRRAGLLFRADFSDNSMGSCVNDAGYVIIVRTPEGLSSSEDVPAVSSYIWHAGQLSGPYRFNAAGIDRRGDMVGNDDMGRPIFEANGHLGPLALPPGAETAEVNVVSDSGIVGGTYVPVGQSSTHGLLWFNSGSYQDISPPPGYSVAWLTSVGDSGTAVMILRNSKWHRAYFPAVYLGGESHLLKMPAHCSLERLQLNVVDEKYVVGSIRTGSKSTGQSYVAVWSPPYSGLPIVRPVKAGYFFARVVPTSDGPAAWPMVLFDRDMAVYVCVDGRLRRLASMGSKATLGDINADGLETGIEFVNESPTLLQRWFPRIFKPPTADERAVIYQTNLPEVLREVQTQSR